MTALKAISFFFATNSSAQGAHEIFLSPLNVYFDLCRGIYWLFSHGDIYVAPLINLMHHGIIILHGPKVWCMVSWAASVYLGLKVLQSICISTTEQVHKKLYKIVLLKVQFMNSIIRILRYIYVPWNSHWKKIRVFINPFNKMTMF